MKNFIRYILFLIPWFLSAILFRGNYEYYRSLNLPEYAPNSIVFIVVWTILYILIAYTIYKVWNYRNKKYFIVLAINYVSNQLYTFFFFTLESTLLGLIDATIVLISSIFLYKYTKDINKRTANLLIPYIIWNIFATILSLNIFLIN